MFADLATESESQLTMGRRAKKTKRDFRCLISRSSIGPCWSSHWVVWFARTVVRWRSQPVSIPATRNGILHFSVLRKKCCFPLLISGYQDHFRNFADCHWTVRNLQIRGRCANRWMPPLLFFWLATVYVNVCTKNYVWSLHCRSWRLCNILPGRPILMSILNV